MKSDEELKMAFYQVAIQWVSLVHTCAMIFLFAIFPIEKDQLLEIGLFVGIICIVVIVLDTIITLMMRNKIKILKEKFY